MVVCHTDHGGPSRRLYEKDGGSNRKLGTGTFEVEGNRQERTKESSWEFILCAEEADIAWNTSRGQRRSTRPHGTGRVLDAESCREGVGSWESVGTASWNELKFCPSAEEADIAWNTSRVSASLHATLTQRPVGTLGGHGKLDKRWNSVEERFGILKR